MAKVNGNISKCPRCNKKLDSESICKSCKSDLTQSYDFSLDWQTAYEIELESQEIRRFNFDL